MVGSCRYPEVPAPRWPSVSLCVSHFLPQVPSHSQALEPLHGFSHGRRNHLLLLLTFSPYPGLCTTYFGSPVVHQWWSQLLENQSFPKSLRAWQVMVQTCRNLWRSPAEAGINSSGSEEPGRFCRVWLLKNLFEIP